MEVIISNNNHVHSTYYADDCTLSTEYKGVFNKSIALEHFHTVEKFAQTQPILGVITNLSKLGGSYNSILEYLEDEGFPKIKKLGLKAEAFIISDDIIIKHLTEKLVQIIKNSGIKVNICQSHQEAKEWLQAVLKS